MDNGGRYFYIKEGETIWNPQEEKFAKSNGELTSLGEKDHHIMNKSRAHEVIRRFSTVEAVDAAFAEFDVWIAPDSRRQTKLTSFFSQNSK